MTTITLALTEDMNAFLEAQHAREGHASAVAYLHALIREAQKRQAKRELEAKLREALESGPPEPMTREDWDSIEREALDRIARDRVAQ